jgi:2,5-diketo-D-gluconate reductase A
MTTVPTVAMGDGVQIPQLGFGTYKVSDEDAYVSVTNALQVGYRHIDTATFYGNESGVGRALAESGIPRDQLFITTKLWHDSLEPEAAKRSLERSLEKLGLEQIDLYLIHWPAMVAHGDLFVKTWDAFQEFKRAGLAKSIGVSNFNIEHLDKLHGEVPAVDQIEVHPTLTQPELVAELARRNITVEAWSPLGRAADLAEPTLVDIGQQVGKSPAQVIIRWHLQMGYVVIPKSTHLERIKDNFNVFDFDLSEDQMAQITALNRNNRTGSNPSDV